MCISGSHCGGPNPAKPVQSSVNANTANANGGAAKTETDSGTKAVGGASGAPTQKTTPDAVKSAFVAQTATKLPAAPASAVLGAASAQKMGGSSSPDISQDLMTQLNAAQEQYRKLSAGQGNPVQVHQVSTQQLAPISAPSQWPTQLPVLVGPPTSGVAVNSAPPGSAIPGGIPAITDEEFRTQVDAKVASGFYQSNSLRSAQDFAKRIASAESSHVGTTNGDVAIVNSPAGPTSIKLSDARRSQLGFSPIDSGSFDANAAKLKASLQQILNTDTPIKSGALDLWSQWSDTVARAQKEGRLADAAAFQTSLRADLKPGVDAIVAKLTAANAGGGRTIGDAAESTRLASRLQVVADSIGQTPDLTLASHYALEQAASQPITPPHRGITAPGGITAYVPASTATFGADGSLNYGYGGLAAAGDLQGPTSGGGSFALPGLAIPTTTVSIDASGQLIGGSQPGWGADYTSLLNGPNVSPDVKAHVDDEAWRAKLSEPAREIVSIVRANSFDGNSTIDLDPKQFSAIWNAVPASEQADLKDRFTRNGISFDNDPNHDFGRPPIGPFPFEGYGFGDSSFLNGPDGLPILGAIDNPGQLFSTLRRDQSQQFIKGIINGESLESLTTKLGASFGSAHLTDLAAEAKNYANDNPFGSQGQVFGNYNDGWF